MEDFEISPNTPLKTNDFWTLYTQLVEIVFLTEPSERLNIVVPYLEDTLGPVQSDLYERVENHVFRTVAWLELAEKDDRFTPEP